MASPMFTTRTARGPLLLLLFGFGVLDAGRFVEGQTFYQVSNPRTYRIDPALTPPLPNGLVPQMLAYRTAGNNGAGTLLLSWQTGEGQPSEALEVAVDLDTPPPPESDNDATLISQIPALQGMTAMDYQSDRQVLVMSRTVGTQQAVLSLGAFTLNGQGGVTGLTPTAAITPPVVPGGLGTNLGPQGIAFGGVRNIADGTYNTGIVVFAGDPSGLWAADLSTGQWLDANKANSGGANAITPLVGWNGNTGVVNQDPDRHQLRGIDVIGDIAFLLTARQRDVNDPNSIEYYLIQVNLLVSEVQGVVNLGDLFDQRITSPSQALGGDLDVSARADGTVRIIFNTPGSGKYIGELDGQLVPIGSNPIGSGTTPQASAVIWVCPGIGIAIPIMILAAGTWFRGTRTRPEAR
jgi:hypothetical protein